MIILRQKEYSKIGELRNKIIRDKAAKMAKTARKNLMSATDSTIQDHSRRINKILTSNLPESKSNELLTSLYDRRKQKLGNLKERKRRVMGDIKEIQEKFPKGSSISRDDFRYGNNILDRHKRMNVYYNQKN